MALMITVCLVIEFLLTLQVNAETTDTSDTRAIPLTTPTTYQCWFIFIPECFYWLGCAWYTGPDGCPVCICPNPSCEDLNCPEGKQCILEPPDSCQQEWCVSKAVCSSYETTDTTAATSTATSTTAATSTDTSTTAATATTASCDPMPVCDFCFGCDYFFRSDGCLDCACPNPSCQELYCPEGTHCILEPPDYCQEKPCVSRAVCSSYETTDTTAVSLTTTSTTEDTSTATSTTAATSTATSTTTATSTDTSTTAATSTATSTTAATATTSSCGPMPVCDPSLGCDYFFRSDGCLDCACPNPSCQELNCPEGKQCILEPPVSCPQKPCVSKAVCSSNDTTTTLTPSTTVRICSSDDVCVNGCVSVSGPDGCPTCSCPPTCEGISCESDEKCILQGVECFTTPCFPQPICVPKQISCDGNPKAERCTDGNTQHGGCVDRWTYNSSMNACERFCYYGCTPSPANTFKSQKKCMAKCKVRRR